MGDDKERDLLPQNHNKLEISGRVLARNTFINFVGQVVPLAVGVLTIPFIIRGLGAERFGLLSLAWVILGYFTIFDLGLGRAVTKYVAEALSKGEEDKVPHLVWTAVTIQAALGLLGTFILVAITTTLIQSVLNIPVMLVEEAKATFHVLALSLPVVLISNSFSGVLEGKQRFDLVNVVRIPSSILTYLLTLFGVMLNFRLQGIAALILGARLGALFVLVVLNFKVFPMARTFSVSFPLFPHLLTYGGWLTVTSVVGPILVYFERFMIASLLSVVAVAYYTAPYEIVTRLWVIPWSLTMTVIPAFSALEGVRDWERLGVLSARSIKYTLLTLGPIVLLLTLFAEEILHIWLGGEFATMSADVMKILGVGILINSLAHIPYALFLGGGRPDIIAKFNLLELPIYIGITWILVGYWGITGAALAWTIRGTLDALLLFGATFKIYRFSPRLFAINGTTLASFGLLVFSGVAYGLKTVTNGLSLVAQSLFFAGLLVLFIWFSWNNVLDDSDRKTVFNVIKIW